jgi:hypothetical protein
MMIIMMITVMMRGNVLLKIETMMTINDVNCGSGNDGDVTIVIYMMVMSL